MTDREQALREVLAYVEGLLSRYSYLDSGSINALAGERMAKNDLESIRDRILAVLEEKDCFCGPVFSGTLEEAAEAARKASIVMANAGCSCSGGCKKVLRADMMGGAHWVDEETQAERKI